MNKSKKSPKGIRGKFLTTVLILSGCALLFDIVRFLQIGSWHDNPLRIVSYPLWYDSIYVTTLTISGVCLVYIFLWKKWAVYVSFIKGIVVFLLELFLRSWNTNYKGQLTHHVLYHTIYEYNLWIFFISVIRYIIIYWSIFRKWKFFK